MGESGSLATKATLPRQHPTYEKVLKLLDVYTDRVDPMIKTLHLPTFRVSLLEAVRQPENVAKPLQALIFAFYVINVQSLDDDECQRILGEKKIAVFRRFKRAAGEALRKAKFMQTSDSTTLRAYLLYIVSIFSLCRQANYSR